MPSTTSATCPPITAMPMAALAMARVAMAVRAVILPEHVAAMALLRRVPMLLRAAPAALQRLVRTAAEMYAAGRRKQVLVAMAAIPAIRPAARAQRGAQAVQADRAATPSPLAAPVVTRARTQAAVATPPAPAPPKPAVDAPAVALPAPPVAAPPVPAPPVPGGVPPLPLPPLPLPPSAGLPTPCDVPPIPPPAPPVPPAPP